MAAIACTAAAAAPAGAATIQLYDIPTHDAAANSIAAAPDGAMWFTENGADKVARITPDGAVSEFDVGGRRPASPGPIVESGGAMYYLDEFGELVERITNAGDRQVVYNDGADTTSVALAPGQGGGVWLLPDANGDGNPDDAQGLIRLEADGTVRTFPADHQFNNLAAIALAPDGAVWFNEAGDALGRVTDDGTTSYASLGPATGREVSAIAFGTDGSPWFSEYQTSTTHGENLECCGRIGHLVDGVAQFTDVGSQEEPNGLLPYALQRGPDGAMWFAFRGAADGDGGYDGIGRLAPDGTLQLANLAPYSARDMAFGKDGKLWFLDGSTDEVGRITIDDSTFPPPASPGTPDAPGTPAAGTTGAASPPMGVTPAPGVGATPVVNAPSRGGTLPVVSVKAARLRVLARRRTLAVRCTLSAAGTCAIRLTIGAKAARSLQLTKRRGGRYTLAKGTATLPGAGTATIRLKLSKKAARALRGARSLHASLIAADAAGASTDTALTLKR